MKSKFFFEEFKDDIEDEHKRFETHYETKEHVAIRCNHKNAKIINNELRCTCGAAWSGSQIETLYKLFTSNV